MEVCIENYARINDIIKSLNEKRKDLNVVYVSNKYALRYSNNALCIAVTDIPYTKNTRFSQSYIQNFEGHIKMIDQIHLKRRRWYKSHQMVNIISSLCDYYNSTRVIITKRSSKNGLCIYFHP
uniref:Uncharacterized protein n=1 Tax=viral metagenome TaxID=1070528 RepID=A0A6C0CLA3_9ZZZZ